MVNNEIEHRVQQGAPTALNVMPLPSDSTVFAQGVLHIKQVQKSFTSLSSDKPKLQTLPCKCHQPLVKQHRNFKTSFWQFCKMCSGSQSFYIKQGMNAIYTTSVGLKMVSLKEKTGGKKLNKNKERSWVFKKCIRGLVITGGRSHDNQHESCPDSNFNTSQSHLVTNSN